MPWDIIRDSAFGHCVRLASKNRLFLYPEERDTGLWRKYVNEAKTAHMADHGDPDPPTQSEGDTSSEKEQEAGAREGSGRENTSTATPRDWRLSDRVMLNENVPVDVEKPSDPDRGKDKLIIDWSGPDDADNPRNWSTGKKLFVNFEICFLTFSVYIGSAIYAAGILDVMETFHVSQVAATLGLTLYVAGYGLGPMVWAPMSEIPYIGRNPVYIATLFVFVMFQIPTAMASNFGMLLAFRFLTGLFGSPALATGGASIIDMYSPRKQSYGIAVWGVSAVCGPVLGPLVGGFAVQAEGWTWTIWELMWLSGFCFVFLFFFLPETSSTNILYRRTRRMRKITGDNRLICEPELMAQNMTGKDIALMVLIRPITLNFTEPMVFLLNLYIALVYGLLYIWFESFPIVFSGIYHFNLGQEGLAFLGLLVGALVVVPPLFYWLHSFQEKRFNEKGELKPEYRLPPAMVGGLFIPVCLFWFGWSARADIHWIMPIIGSGFFAIGAFLLFQAVLPYLADAYPEYAASVFAGNDLFRSSFGAGFPLFANAMYKNLGVPWASSTLAFLGIAFIPIPYVLYIYGERLRRMSRHAKKDF
ncbi:benomyl/methotrexate resistance protein [Amniculicola lignicola CBS 123094]|uniref:Benomyl/methotrexate resistance protein n=1 Tax=Amniculicola lignicola CBS 123094 TaxID=1392246 RepID=A0A6A5WQ11_9PLEO|nr:benomyl/methotrexate resistance protein [Amniculicola lignicola CBS 123094]